MRITPATIQKFQAFQAQNADLAGELVRRVQAGDGGAVTDLAQHAGISELEAKHLSLEAALDQAGALAEDAGIKGFKDATSRTQFGASDGGLKAGGTLAARGALSMQRGADRSFNTSQILGLTDSMARAGGSAGSYGKLSAEEWAFMGQVVRGASGLGAMPEGAPMGVDAANVMRVCQELAARGGFGGAKGRISADEARTLASLVGDVAGVIKSEGNAAAGYASGTYDLPGGTSMFIRDGGQVWIDPGQHDAKSLEHQGFRWQGESGMLAPPVKDGRAVPGEYELPSGGALQVRDDGAIWYSPDSLPSGSYDLAFELLEKQGFRNVGETGCLEPPAGPLQGHAQEWASGTFALPGGMHMHLEKGTLMIDPGQHDAEGLEKQGFTWQGESGMLSPPQANNAFVAGTYQLPGGGSLFVGKDNDVMYDPSGLPSGDYMRAFADLSKLGFREAGESGMLALPTSARRP